MTEKTWAHALRILTDEELETNSRIGWTKCSSGSCRNPRTHESSYSYVTGKTGRTSSARRQICSGHAFEFAQKYGLKYEGPEPVAIAYVHRSYETCAICGGRSQKLTPLPIDVVMKRFNPETKQLDSIVIPKGSLVHSWKDSVWIKRGVAWDLGLLESIYSTDDDQLIEIYIGSLLRAVARKNNSENGH